MSWLLLCAARSTHSCTLFAGSSLVPGRFIGESAESEEGWLNVMLDELFTEFGPNVESWDLTKGESLFSDLLVEEPVEDKGSPEQAATEDSAFEATDLDLLVQAAESLEGEQAPSLDFSEPKDDEARQEQTVVSPPEQSTSLVPPQGGPLAVGKVRSLLLDLEGLTSGRLLLVLPANVLPFGLTAAQLLTFCCSDTFACYCGSVCFRHNL